MFCQTQDPLPREVETVGTLTTEVTMTGTLTINGTTGIEEDQESETGQNTSAPQAKSITTTARQKYLNGKSQESGWTVKGTGVATLRTGTLKETEDTVAAPEVPLEQVCCRLILH